MTLHTKFSLAILPLALAASASAADADWSAIAQADMRYAIDAVRSNHAGAVSGQIDVTAPLEAGSRAGMIEAANARTEQDYRRALLRFISGFGDPHTGIALRLPTRAWTGVVLDHVDGGYRVIWSEPDWPQPLPPRGAAVQSCDGVWIGTYLKSNVAPFSNQSLEYATTPSELARLSMFDIGLGWTPQRCTFQLAGGAARDYALPLRAIEDGIGQARVDAVRQRYTARAGAVGLTPLAAGQQWVAMPNFNGGLSADAFGKLYRQLAALKHTAWVVFDLRGNGGGDSSWGNRALQALYGQAYAEQLDRTTSYRKTQIASPAAIALFQRYASLPQFAAAKPMFDDAIAKMTAALERGEPMARVEDMSAQQADALAVAVRRRPSGPRLAAVIDRGCFSSCMNFLQQISAIADTVVLGEPTIGYSPYGEIGPYPLPSGHGVITLPSAIYAGAQATREPFVPAFRYRGDMADEAALKAWVTTTLNAIRPAAR